MLFIKKLFIVLSLYITSVFIFSNVAYAQPTYDFDMVTKAKHDLFENHTVLQSLNSLISSEAIDKELARLVAHRTDPQTVENTMSLYGIYKLCAPNEDLLTLSPVTDDDVIINNPSIYLDSNSGEWIVVCGGYWKGDDPGAKDSFGVSFVNTSGNIPTLNSMYRYLSDSDNTEENSTAMTDGDGSSGFSFSMQADQTSKHGKPSYVDKHFAGLARYSSNFVDYNGWASTYYNTTWNSVNIQSIKLNVGFGIQNFLTLKPDDVYNTGKYFSELGHYFSNLLNYNGWFSPYYIPTQNKEKFLSFTLGVSFKTGNVEITIQNDPFSQKCYSGEKSF